MSEKNCKSCIDNEDGFCDRKGVLVEEDDTCENWNGGEEWKEHFLRTFLAGHYIKEEWDVQKQRGIQ